MKKILFSCSAILFANLGFSQTIYTADGTITANRTVILNNKNLNFVPIMASPTVGNFFINGTNGNIGLGTTTPTSRFHLNSGDMTITSGSLNLGTGNANFTSGRLIIGTVANFNDAVTNWGIKSQRSILIAGSTNPGLQVRSTEPTANSWADFAVATVDYGFSNVSKKGDVVLRGMTGGSLIINADNGSDMKFTTEEAGADKVRMRIDKFGKVGIGMEGAAFSTNTLYANYKLFVTGGILTDEIRVVLSSGNTWADYVFKDDYILKPLAEVETYIKEKGHLPNVPSEKEVKEDGINLGEMVKIQQEKIEELTLYIIEMNKEIQKLKARYKN